MQRLTRPGSIGHFAPGIFLGTLLQIVSLLLADVAGLVATVQNYRQREHPADSSKIALRLFGGLFVLMGVVIMVSGLHVDRYHNLMHLVWGALALGVSFAAVRVTKLFCIGSGLFYMTLAILGLTIGNPALQRAWQAGPMLLHTGDHVFHLVLGAIFLGFGLVSGRVRQYQETPA
jgi:hypothetical protein